LFKPEQNATGTLNNQSQQNVNAQNQLQRQLYHLKSPFLQKDLWVHQKQAAAGPAFTYKLLF
jgi:hypothetical protein